MTEREFVQELSSPTLILDLMVACWSEHPHDRPSARDVHRLASSLEFRHLMDVIEIDQREEFHESNTLAVVSYRESKELFVFLRIGENEKRCLDEDNDDEDDNETGIPTADCWFIRPSKEKQQSSMVIVAYDQFNAVHQQV